VGVEATDTRSYVGPDHVGEEILCVRDVSFRYPDGTEALSHVDLHVQRGSTVAIVGPNGAGKTTLLKILLGLLEGYTGSVEVAGLSPQQGRRRGGVVSWVPQRQKMHWDFPVTVEQVVRMGLVGKTRMLRRHRRDDLDHVRHLMAALSIAELGDRPIGAVSGGQQQRAIIARALAPRPALLMLDEPTVGVDQAGQQAFAELMARIRGRFGVTLVIVSHDLRTVLPDCERVACLNRTLHFHDSPSRLTPELLGEVFRCDLTGLFPARQVGPDGPRPQPAQPPGEAGGPRP
jgi:zinc transport system ATP-binding protein